MPPLLWSDSLRVGHSPIDDIHQSLVQRLTTLHKAVQAQATTAEVLGLFDDWLDEFARHARLEEQLMERLALPAGITHRHEHIAEHADFLHQAMDARALLVHGGDGAAAMDTLTIHLVSFDLIRRDFELVGLLLREGIRPDE